MPEWTASELSRIGGAEEVQVAAGPSGSHVTIWIVRHGDDLFVRSAVKGRDAAWFRAAHMAKHGRLSAGNLEKDVTFVDADAKLNDDIDAAYRSKYRRYTGRILDSCLTPEARSTTLRVVPR